MMKIENTLLGEIVKLWNDEYNSSICINNVAITSGCNQAFCAAISTIASAGDSILVPVPWYFNHEMWLSIQGINIVPLRCDANMFPDFEKAKDSYLDARKLAKQLASFYSDLNTSFKGVDARIPKEMQIKGKETLQILAESNKRLASLYIKDEKPDVAVPLLVETIRIMSPDSKEGREAYERLIQLGFVETKYKG